MIGYHPHDGSVDSFLLRLAAQRSLLFRLICAVTKADGSWCPIGISLDDNLFRTPVIASAAKQSRVIGADRNLHRHSREGGNPSIGSCTGGTMDSRRRGNDEKENGRERHL
jgi:1-acyl-sn-glycerol-3-phosphate acyltransferase